jgi:hypothetical protein
MAFNLVYPCEIDISGTRLTKYNTDGSIVCNDTLNNTIWTLDGTGLRLNDPTTFAEVARITDNSIVLNSLETEGQGVEILASQISVKAPTIDDRKCVISGNSYNVKKLDETVILSMSENGLSVINTDPSIAVDNTTNKVVMDGNAINFRDSATDIAIAKLQPGELSFYDLEIPNLPLVTFNFEGMRMYDVSDNPVPAQTERANYAKTGMYLFDVSGGNSPAVNIYNSAGIATSFLSSSGLDAKVFSTVQATLDATCSLSLLQGTDSGFYTPIFDSGLTYNPSTNLLSVGALALSTSVNTPTFATGVLTIDCAFASSREFSYAITANITGLNLTNRRSNGVYKITITNNSGASRTVSSSLSGNATNRTNYNPPGNAPVAVGEFFVMTVQVLSAGGADVNFVNLMKYA